MRKKALSRAEREQIARLKILPEEAIDVADIPEAPPENWIYARRGDFYRPVKKPVTIRLDADVLSWFKERAGGRGYQTEINRVLRKHVARAASAKTESVSRRAAAPRSARSR